MEDFLKRFDACDKGTRESFMEAVSVWVKDFSEIFEFYSFVLHTGLNCRNTIFARNKRGGVRIVKHKIYEQERYVPDGHHDGEGNHTPHNKLSAFLDLFFIASGADVAHDTPQKNDGGDNKKEWDYRVYCGANAGNNAFNGEVSQGRKFNY